MQRNSQYGSIQFDVDNRETRWATPDEIKRSCEHVLLSDHDYKAAGLPILSDGVEAYVDNMDTHSLIFGATGSKKTRLFCMPLIDMLIRGGESFVATDPKGELYERTSGMAKEYGYNTLVLDLRRLSHGDSWNPMLLAYDLYHSDRKQEGISMMNDFIQSLAEPSKNNTQDLFWPTMACSYILANMLLLAECGAKEQFNIKNITLLSDASNAQDLRMLMDRMDDGCLAKTNYSGVLSAAKDTMLSIFASVYGILGVFNTQDDLAKMLSTNTIDLREIGREKTAVYLIVPDEKTTYHFLATAFIKQAYEVLIAEAQKEAGRKLPVRVNFVLDEFCNMPKVPDMPSMISAARSRNMRYFIVVQSLHQLRGKYGEDADTIKGNCDNWVFLTSREMALLEEISGLCGTYRGRNGEMRRLISISELQRLNKQKGESLIMHERQYPIITELADIDDYEMFKGYEPLPLKKRKESDTKLFDLKKLVRDVLSNSVPAPFSTTKESNEYDEIDRLQKMLFGN